MSAAALIALAETFASVDVITEGAAGKTPADAFRNINDKFSKHRVFLNRQEVAHEVADLLYNGLGYDITGGKYDYLHQINTDNIEKPYIFNEGDLFILVDKIIENLVAAFGELKRTVESTPNGGVITIHASKQEVIVDVFSTVNNFSKIGKVFEKAWEGKGQTGNFKEFVLNTLEKNAKKNSSLYLGVAESVERPKTGAAVGHGRSSSYDVSNIENFINIIGINALRSSPQLSLEDLTTKECQFIIDDVTKLLKNNMGLREFFHFLRRSGLITTGYDSFEGLMQTYLDTTVSLIGKVSNKDNNLQLKVEQRIQNPDQLKNGALKLVTDTRFQSMFGNSLKGAVFEGALGALTAERNRALFGYMSEWLSGKRSFIGTRKSGTGKAGRKFTANLEDDAAVLPHLQKGSKSFSELIADNIYENLQFGKATVKTKNSKGNRKNTPETVQLKKFNPLISVTTLIPKKAKLTPTKVKKQVREKVSLTNITNLINMQLAETIRQNMGSPKLNWRTGRFAASARVLIGSMDKDGYLRLPYTYMKYPYQTFEMGFARGDPNRDPRKVISESVRELAIRMVLMKMRVVRV